jgi:hypothetical protein
MRTTVLALIWWAGCAASNEAARPTAGGCPIADIQWPAANESFDRSKSAAVLQRLDDTVRADRDAFRADPSGRGLGPRLDELTRSVEGNAFVDGAVAQAAQRTRQLECAILRGGFAGKTAAADRLYTEILEELDSQIKVARAR